MHFKAIIPDRHRPLLTEVCTLVVIAVGRPLSAPIEITCPHLKKMIWEAFMATR
jgi:hypothetical protein